MNFSKMIDISWPISETMTAYKDRQVVRFVQTKTFEKDHARESMITLGTHSGTHIDAPSHFLADGKTVDSIPLDRFNGPCQVLDLNSCHDKITADDLQKQKIVQDIVLLKTQNSLLPPDVAFLYPFVYLTADAAQWLAEKKVKAVGIDYLGIERNQPGHETHKALMSRDIIIIEGLRLNQIDPGEYVLCCLPLLVSGLEAAPARAVLLQ